MVYYQQPAAAEWYGAGPQQRIMYMQYVQPGRTHARSTQAASALVAGETVATGTYLKGKQTEFSWVQFGIAQVLRGIERLAHRVLKLIIYSTHQRFLISNYVYT